MTTDTGQPPPPPRAFAQGTGVMLQTVGMILFLSSCLICSLSSWWHPMQDRGEVIEQVRTGQTTGGNLLRDIRERPVEAGYAMTVIFSTVGGLGLAVFGLGLQAERRRAGVAAMVTASILLFILLIAGALLWHGGAAWPARILHGLLTFTVAVVALFTWHAMRQVLADPPPADIDIVPPGTKIPYSFYHEDSPEVRLAKELANRRAKLDAEKLEIEKMERELKDREPGEKP